MFPRAALVLAGLLVLGIVFVVFVAPLRFFEPMRAQMRAGSAYMKSLSDSDMPVWVERSKSFLAEYRPETHPVGVYGLGDRPVPSDLAQLKIIRVDIFEDRVCYVWMGGMDHTYLEARRLPDGSFTVIAHYNDYKSEVLWPKRPNQAMQRTASKRATDVMRVCHPRFDCVASCSGLAVADLLSR